MPADDPSRKSYRSRPGWTGYGKPPGRWYDYGDTGWQVQHCGHPTAIRPYMILDPEGRMVLHPATGLAFTLLVDAQEWTEILVRKGSDTGATESDTKAGPG